MCVLFLCVCACVRACMRACMCVCVRRANKEIFSKSHYHYKQRTGSCEVSGLSLNPDTVGVKAVWCAKRWHLHGAEEVDHLCTVVGVVHRLSQDSDVHTSVHEGHVQRTIGWNFVRVVQRPNDLDRSGN